jgi:hypothetical protein
MEITEDKIKQAGKPSMILLWRRIYNTLCRKCQMKVFKAASDLKDIGTQKVSDKMQYTIQHELCVVCKRRIDLIMKKEV